MIYINNQEKLNRIKLNKDNFYVVADFDRTLTAGTSNSTWGIMAEANCVGEEYTRKRKELYNYYRPIEIDPNISDEEKSLQMNKWWKEHISLFYEYGLQEDVIKKSLVSGGLFYRNGAKEFLKKMYELNIPVIIISAGIGNVIEEFFNLENDYYDNIKIISNFIDFKDGKIDKIRGKTIHALNKNIIELDNTSKENLTTRENILLLGDGLADLKMVSEDKKCNTISVGFLDEKIDENLEVYNKGFDIVLTEEGTFEEVNKIIKIY